MRTAEERAYDRYGVMVVVRTDQHAGRRYRCPCGVYRWSVWGAAEKHAQTCPRAKPTTNKEAEASQPKGEGE